MINKKELLLISFTVFLTVLAWVVSDIYHASKVKSILRGFPTPTSLEMRFDPKVFDVLRQRSYDTDLH